MKTKKSLFSKLESSIIPDFQGFDDFFETLQTLMPVNVAKGEIEDSSESGEESEYAKLGEKLMSLARSVMPAHRHYNTVEEKLAETELDEKIAVESNLMKLATVIRRLIHKAGENGNIIDDPYIKELQAITPDIPWILGTYDEVFVEPDEGNFGKTGNPDRDLLGRFYGENCIKPKDFAVRRNTAKKKVEERTDANGRTWVTYKRYTKKGSDPNEQVLYLYCPMIWPDRLIANLKLDSNTRNRKFRGTKVYMDDIALAIAYLYMINAVYRGLFSDYFRSTTAFKRLSEAAMIHTYGFTGDYSISLTMQDILAGMKDEKYQVKKPMDMAEKYVFLLPNSNFEDNAEILQELLGCKRVSAIPYNLEERPEDSAVYYTFENLITSKEAEVLKKSWEDNKGCYMLPILKALKKTHDEIVFLNDLSVLTNFLARLPEMDEQRAKDFCSTLVREGFFTGDVIYPGINTYARYMSSAISLCATLFYGVHEVDKREVKEIKEEAKENVDRARVFETKRNIPKKILKIMEESVLNERFGYIEYDELCDTDKIGTTNEQLLQFVRDYFPDIDLKEISLRFRRLGNYRAGGLYVPDYKCICISLVQPSSFVHEFGHMLDFTSGKLSDRMRNEAFSVLYAAYKACLDKKLTEKPEEAEALFKKSKKYNYDYYIKETEVFARCFEMYIYTKLGLENTISKSKEQFAQGNSSPFVYHLEDEAFLEKVVGYFDALDICKDVVDKAAAKKAA